MKRKNFSRREFMSTMAAGAGALLIGNNAWYSRFSSDPFQKVALGKSGLKTTLLGMGTGYIGTNRSSNITRAGRETAIALIKYAYEKGIRFFDCADAYGTHPHTMEALKGFSRDSYTLSSKIWLNRNGGIPETERPDANIVVDRFRKELNTDYIDLIQIHLQLKAET